MNFLPAAVRGDRLELPFLSLPLTNEIKSSIGDRTLLIAGIRPEHFADASLVEDHKKHRGVTFQAEIDVTEWLGAEQYAFIPYEAPDEIAHQLADLEHELDSEQLRTQMVVSLDPSSRIRDGEAAELWLDPSRMHLFDPRSGENLTLPRGAHASVESETTEVPSTPSQSSSAPSSSAPSSSAPPEG
jgi:multiple sugar transport system ATP-binding protein